MDEIIEHKPVLLKEVCEFLITGRDGVYVDCTTGLGGHSLALMRSLGKKARLVAIDADAQSLKIAAQNLKEFEGRIDFVHSDYSKLPAILGGLGIKRVNGILLDLGFSSYQIDNPARGFSFGRNGPLDMRYDTSKGITAAQYLEKADYSELEAAIREYGEERLSKRVASAILQARKRKKIESTFELADIVRGVLGHKRHSRIDPATKVFQALRIAVNRELEHLEGIMVEIAESIISKGRLAVISFHSLEDKIVKQYIFNNSRGCTCSPYVPKCVCGHKKVFNVIVPRIIRPSIEESAVNPRARSARLRVAEKI